MSLSDILIRVRTAWASPLAQAPAEPSLRKLDPIFAVERRDHTVLGLRSYQGQPHAQVAPARILVLALLLSCLDAARSQAQVSSGLQQRAQILEFLQSCWLKGQAQGPVSTLQRCYAPDAKVSEAKGETLPGALASRIAALAPPSAGGPPSIDFDLLDVTTGKTPYVELLLHRRLRDGADEASVTLSLINAADGSLRIQSESNTVTGKVAAAELPPRLRGQDWLQRAQLKGAHPLLWAFLKRPEKPMWAEALLHYLGEGPLDCAKREERQGCVSSSWGYASLQDSAAATDGCLHRLVVRAALQKLDAAGLGKVLPALVEIVQQGAFDYNADLALAVLAHIPAGNFALTGKLLRTLSTQAAGETENRMPILDEHLASLPEDPLRSLVGRNQTYSGVALALLAKGTLSAPGCQALALAVRTVPIRDREARIRALWGLVPCPAQSVAADLRQLGLREGDRYVRFTAALVLSAQGDQSLLPDQKPPQSDRDVLDLAALAAVEPDGPERSAHLKALILPGAVLEHTVEQENENEEVVTRHRNEPLTVEGLRTALELRKLVPPTKYPSGYEGLSRAGGFMGEPERYDLKPGRSKDGRWGLLRVYHHESHVGGSC